MTVCVVARAGNFIVGAADRMLTSGDVQFEPSAGMKIVVLTRSIFMMTAGDSALQTEVSGRVYKEVSERITVEPSRWWYVSEAVDVYIRHYNEIKKKRAENQILAPLGLTLVDFQNDQRSMSDQLVNDIAKELLNFELASGATIIAGLDPDGPHIYAIYDNEPRCLDGVGFASVGSGSRHASSQFMLARHAWNADFADTLMLTYYAKRKAEVAPGVGRGTDMVVVGPELNSFTPIGDHVIHKLDQEYNRIVQSEASAFSRAKARMRTYVVDITSQAQASAAASGGQQASPPADGGGAPADRPQTESSEEAPKGP